MRTRQALSPVSDKNQYVAYDVCASTAGALLDSVCETEKVWVSRAEPQVS